jgi:hypothetical protein
MMRRGFHVLCTVALSTVAVALGWVAPASGERVRTPTPKQLPGPSWLPAVWRPGAFYLRDTQTSGIADHTVLFGDPAQPETPLLCDWDGDGTSTPGVVRGNQWFITNATTSSPADVSFAYGDAGDIPVCADWTTNGAPSGPQTPAVVRVSGDGLMHVFAKRTVTGGTADTESTIACVVFRERASDGDFQALPGGAFSDGTPWVGCHVADFFYFPPDRPSTSPMPPPGAQWEFGISGDVAVGLPTRSLGALPLGVFRPGTAEWFVMGSSDHTQTSATFRYGDPGDVPLSWVKSS